MPFLALQELDEDAVESVGVAVVHAVGHHSGRVATYSCVTVAMDDESGDLDLGQVLADVRSRTPPSISGRR